MLLCPEHIGIRRTINTRLMHELERLYRDAYSMPRLHSKKHVVTFVFAFVYLSASRAFLYRQ